MIIFMQSVLLFVDSQNIVGKPTNKIQLQICLTFRSYVLDISLLKLQAMIRNIWLVCIWAVETAVVCQSI